jgi:hypothetical protein
MHGSQMRRRGGRKDPGERQSGQDGREDGGKDGLPAVPPVSADPAMPSMMVAHDSSKAIPWAPQPFVRGAAGPAGIFNCRVGIIACIGRVMPFRQYQKVPRYCHIDLPRRFPG